MVLFSLLFPVGNESSVHYIMLMQSVAPQESHLENHEFVMYDGRPAMAYKNSAFGIIT